MAKPLRPKRGTTAKNDAFVGLASEITVDTEKHSIRVHDGVTAGGYETLMTSGGTITGAITVDGSTLAKAKTDDGVYALRGGTGVSNCPRFVLYGPSNASAPGTFMVHANDGVNGDKTLEGKSDGTLTWGGNKIITSAGGTMTGVIRTTNTTSLASSTNDTSVQVHGGTGYGNGAYLNLRGKSKSGEEGMFSICALDGTNSKVLSGKPDGNLMWNSNHVLTDNYTNAWCINRELGHIYKKDANGRMVIRGGTSAGTDGAMLQLCGTGYTSELGQFKLLAHNGTNGKTLLGKPDGSLTWDGRAVLNVPKYGNGTPKGQNESFTAPSAGLVLFWADNGTTWGGHTLTVNGQKVGYHYGKESGCTLYAFVQKGDTVLPACSGGNQNGFVCFYPFV